MTFHPGAPRLEPDPCRPSSPADCCSSCARRNDSLPVPPILRPAHVLLDVSLMAWPDGTCPLRIPAAFAQPQETPDVDAVPR